MGKVESIVKSEIVRLARRELRQVSVPLGRDIRGLKITVSGLRKSVRDLERFAAQRQKESAKREVLLEASPEEVKKSRLSPRLIQSLRKKLGITQKELSVLVGVTVGAVHQWEVGNFEPATPKKAALVALRKLTRTAAKKLLAERSAQ